MEEKLKEVNNPQKRKKKLWLYDGKKGFTWYPTERNEFWRNNDKIFIVKNFSFMLLLNGFSSAFLLAFILHNNLLLLLLHYLNENFMENFTFEAVICYTKETVTVVACVDVWETIIKISSVVQ